MKLSERFQKAANHYYGIAKDPWMIGVCATGAACALPFSAYFSAIAITAPVAYAAVGTVSKTVGYGLKHLGQ